MKNNILKFKIGFTLIETLVAISILTAAIAGPLVMSIKNIGTAYCFPRSISGVLSWTRSYRICEKCEG